MCIPALRFTFHQGGFAQFVLFNDLELSSGGGGGPNVRHVKQGAQGTRREGGGEVSRWAGHMLLSFI